jgi:hypothetical protein
MNTTFATRTRPFTSPYPIDNIRSEAVASRDQRNRARAARIKSLVAAAPSDNKDEFYWTMIYDLEEAPTMTARSMLLEHGIIPVPPQELITTADLHDELWTVIEALSRCGVFLINTNHLCDRDLYSRLYYRILDEECRAMPPSTEAAEYVDCLHPMDLQYPLGKQMPQLTSAPEPQPAGNYARGPEYNVIGAICDRDDYLPRPW